MSQIITNLQTQLTELGFPCGVIDGVNGPATRTAVARFQLAYNLGRHLDVDGLYGPMTLGALSEVRRTGRLSPNFTVNELRSKGDRSCWIHRDTLVALERLRSHVGRPLAVVSGWRDVAHNQRVGGARTSQHTFGAAPELQRIASRLSPRTHIGAGRAIDFNQGYIRLEDCQGLRIFSGIGHRNGWVTHVDIRTNATPARPTVWVYG